MIVALIGSMKSCARYGRALTITSRTCMSSRGELKPRPAQVMGKHWMEELWNREQCRPALTSFLSAQGQVREQCFQGQGFVAALALPPDQRAAN